jgi:CHAT domain
VLRVRFEQTGQLADVDAAISACERALKMTPDRHPFRAEIFAILATTWQATFTHTRALTDLNAAVAARKRAVAATDDGQPDQAGMLANLGRTILFRHEHLGDPADLDVAMHAGRRGAGVVSAAASTRVSAAVVWGRAAGAAGQWQEAVDGYAAAIGLLGRVSPRSLGRCDQEGVLANLPGLGTSAVACCVQAGMAERAVELFEQSRGVLLGYSLDSRTDLTDLTDLTAAHPALAERFIALRDALDRHPEPGQDSARAWRKDRRHRIDKTAEFDELVRKIQALPGFAGFLAPPSIDELRMAASDGPIVVVNVADERSDALIVTADGIQEPLPLPGLSPKSVADQALAFFAAVSEWSGSPSETNLSAVLGWLWDTVTKPVLDRLGITGPPPAGPDGTPDWPRIWWCPSGLLSFLPLHASGHHDRLDASGNAEAVLDRVVSSYTPTLRALTYARRRFASETIDPDGTGEIVAVAMEHTPGLNPMHDLPAAGKAVAMLSDLFPGRVRSLANDAATRRDVLRALQGARWAHFACHARADLREPSQGQLLLSDWARKPLTVVDVARLRLNNAELAFLSACSMAQGGVPLADEMIHLGSAFQLAGFRHVIATLWPVEDDSATMVASDTYRMLQADGNTHRAAFALHTATRALRERARTKPSTWATHIHAGI